MSPKKLTITQASIKDYVKSEIKRIDEEIDEASAFEYIASQQVLTQYDLDDDETARGQVGGGNDGGYDGIYIFVNENLVNGENPDSIDVPRKAIVDFHFIQAKYQPSLQEVVIQNWKDSFSNLINEDEPDSFRYNQDVIEHFALIKAILKKTMTNKLRVSITFWAVSYAEEIHPNIVTQANELKEKVGHILPAKNTAIDVKLVNAAELYSMIDQAPDETVTLKGTKEPLCPDDCSAIITVSLQDYNDFTTDSNGNLKKSLFEANIRDYQGNIEVNKAIRQTLQSNDSVDFWWLNNGITIVADAVTRDMNNSITLTNPRIVNGLQTSNEIWNYCRESAPENEHRKVLVKCIASEEQEIRARIIQATNNQSSIPPAYLRSLETIHLQIERYFRSHGLHYDRRKSSCKNEGIPAKDIITVPFLGQCLISTLLQQPDYARARPAQILSDNEKYKKIFNDDIPLEAYYNIGKISIHIRQWLKGSGLSRGKQNDLLFYVILVACAKQAGTFNLKPRDLESLSCLTNSELEEIAAIIDREYMRMGGSSVVAKSALFVKTIQSAFEGHQDI